MSYSREVERAGLDAAYMALPAGLVCDIILDTEVAIQEDQGNRA